MTENQQAHSNPQAARNRFGTFGGVFTPSILTILGVIMFMRANLVIGEAGVYAAILILLFAKSITFFTTLSISAISTNMQVRGGGAYYMISRVLGPEFGGAIGIALFWALSLSVPFYILGFTEAFVRSFPQLAPHFQSIAFVAAAVFFVIAFIGAGWAIKTQYIIMAILFAAIAAFMGGALQLFDLEQLKSNLQPGYTPISSGSPRLYSFWLVFAIYFPAVTGIDAGVNMSGDLENPGKSIPRGTLAAVGLGFLVYFSQIVIAGGAFSRADLIARPYQCLHDNAIFGLGFLVSAGVFAATLSSALGSYLSAPRVLQAVSRDPVLPFLSFLGKGTARGDEPRRALIMVGVITVVVLLWAGNEAEGGALNAVAAVVTMFFLFSYGTLNVAAFIEGVSRNPSFRPRFRYFHWATAMIGAGGCVGAALLVNAKAAVVAALVVGGLIWYVRQQHLRSTFGDARRGFIYSTVRDNLIRLMDMREDSRNWRPTVLIFSGSPKSRELLVCYGIWLEAGRGIAFLANILEGDFDDIAQHRAAAERQLSEFCREKNLRAFPVAVVAKDVESGTSMLLQTTAIGPLRPNLAVFGWSNSGQRIRAYVKQLRAAAAMNMSLVLINERNMPLPGNAHRIDVWWRGRKNGSLMMLLTHLITRNWEWEGAGVRVLRMIENEAGRKPAMSAMRQTIEQARLDAVCQAIVSDRPFGEVLQRHSADATCVLLGFEIPQPDTEESWHSFYDALLREMPTTIIVNSQGREDMMA